MFSPHSATSHISTSLDILEDPQSCSSTATQKTSILVWHGVFGLQLGAEGKCGNSLEKKSRPLRTKVEDERVLDQEATPGVVTERRSIWIRHDGREESRLWVSQDEAIHCSHTASCRRWNE